MTLRRSTPPLLAAVLLAGCVHDPRVNVVEPTARPTLAPAPAYSLSVQDDRLPADGGGANVLKQALDRHGWTEGRGPGAWTIQAAYAVRPEHVGARLDEETWLTEPRRTPWWRRTRAVHTLTLSLVAPDALTESYRVSAWISGPVKPPAETLRALSDAAAARLDPEVVQPAAPASSTSGSATTKQAPSPSGS